MIKEVAIKHLSKIAYSVTVIEEDGKAYSFPFDYGEVYNNLGTNNDIKNILNSVIEGFDNYNKLGE